MSASIRNKGVFVCSLIKINPFDLSVVIAFKLAKYNRVEGDRYVRRTEHPKPEVFD